MKYLNNNDYYILILIIFLLFIIFVYFILYRYILNKHLYKCDYFFPKEKTIYTNIKYKIKNYNPNAIKNKIVLTVPHNCLENMSINSKHICDFIASDIASYIAKNIKFAKIIKSDNNRFSIDDNRTNASVGLPNKSLITKTIILPNNGSTFLWKNLIEEIREGNIKCVLDIHSYPNNILNINDNVSFIIFRPKNINKTLNVFLHKHEKLLSDNNINILNVCPHNEVNAITEMCNQNNIPSLLLEFNENKNILNIKKDINIFLNLLENDLHID